uniref:Uncharacterized protein n=1 Tax=Octopus bimaculoides TaxID=37653 RepID=A0A0L8HXS4_OCTBM
MVNAEEEEKLCQDENNLTSAYDLLSYVGIVLVLIGLIFISLSYVVPREYIFDINRKAREMEEIENEYSDRRFMLDIFATIGAACIGLSGVIVSVIFTRHICAVMHEDDSPDIENADTGPRFLYGAIKH